MFNGLKYFINNLDVAFSKAFLGSQSTARKVLKDRLMAKLNKDIDGREFAIVSGASLTADIPEFDNGMACVRGNGAGAYSSAYHVDVIANIFKEIIAKHHQEIVKYLGSDFLYEPPLFFRTLHMPSALATYDVYSNIWHQDSHDGDRLLKIFVCLMDIGDQDGPFMFLNRENTLKYWPELVDRWDFKKIAAVPEFPEQQFTTGVKGTYLIINTANCMHRASIPQKYRDMMQITLYPKWRQSSDRKMYLL